jgi:hypothetical protein
MILRPEGPGEASPGFTLGFGLSRGVLKGRSDARTRFPAPLQAGKSLNGKGANRGQR